MGYKLSQSLYLFSIYLKGMGDRLGLLKDLFEHIMREAPFLGRLHIPMNGKALFPAYLSTQDIFHYIAILAKDGIFTIIKDYGIPGKFYKGIEVRPHIMGLVA